MSGVFLVVVLLVFLHDAERTPCVMPDLVATYKSSALVLAKNVPGWGLRAMLLVDDGMCFEPMNQSIDVFIATCQLVTVMFCSPSRRMQWPPQISVRQRGLRGCLLPL